MMYLLLHTQIYIRSTHSNVFKRLFAAQGSALGKKVKRIASPEGISLDPDDECSAVLSLKALRVTHKPEEGKSIMPHAFLPTPFF